MPVVTRLLLHKLSKAFFLANLLAGGALRGFGLVFITEDRRAEIEDHAPAFLFLHPVACGHRITFPLRVNP